MDRARLRWCELMEAAVVSADQDAAAQQDGSLRGAVGMASRGRVPCRCAAPSRQTTPPAAARI